MKVKALASSDLSMRLSSEKGLAIKIGPYVTRMYSPVPSVAEGVHLLYADFSISDDAFADFHISVKPPASIRRWLSPQIDFYMDAMKPFKPLPLSQAFPMLEWGLNWCISNYDNQHLIIHAAVIEKNGFAAILPAPPGSGKSTLCAGLVNRGWRLLSDEMTLISRRDGRIVPLPRPANLKNASIDVMRQFAPDAVLGSEAKDTSKGTVAHMRAPSESVSRMSETVIPAWVIFPKYEAHAAAKLVASPAAEAFIFLAENAFNYSVLRREGFDLLGGVIDSSQCYHFTYSDLDEAVETFDALHPSAAALKRRDA